MIVRLPRSAVYAVQVEKEQAWLPRLAGLLPLPIPVPLALGAPSDEYPWNWSVYSWLEGDTATRERIANFRDFATSLAGFLDALHRIDSTSGPPPGQHNFYRGGSLMTYDAQTRESVTVLGNRIDAALAVEVWETALATAWRGAPVWIHGDVSPGNLLVQNGGLSAVIDFGMLAVGDPACDLSIAWTLFKGDSRELFMERLRLDNGTWARGRGWALWKALIVLAGLAETNAVESARPLEVIEEVLADHLAYSKRAV
jgi:aminoglycoside phosphotransferase (APT) family kinase protein